jgi:hypothetical protein
VAGLPRVVGDCRAKGALAYVVLVEARGSSAFQPATLSTHAVRDASMSQETRLWACAERRAISRGVIRGRFYGGRRGPRQPHLTFVSPDGRPRDADYEVDGVND